MKHYWILLVALWMLSCEDAPSYDAMGRFEATDVVVCAESEGRILNFTVEEGGEMNLGETVGVIVIVHPT